MCNLAAYYETNGISLQEVVSESGNGNGDQTITSVLPLDKVEEFDCLSQVHFQLNFICCTIFENNSFLLWICPQEREPLFCTIINVHGVFQVFARITFDGPDGCIFESKPLIPSINVRFI